MATGMAIMGFGGGALIASPLSVALMDYFKTASDTGVLATFITMGVIYLGFMMLGAYFVKVPPPSWAPSDYVAPTESSGMITRANVEVNEAMKTPQFYSLWGGTVHVCVGRHWGARPGVPDDPGDVPRPGNAICGGGFATIPAYLRDMFGTMQVGAIHGRC